MSCEFLQNCKSLQYSDLDLHKLFSSCKAAHDLPFAALEPELLPYIPNSLALHELLPYEGMAVSVGSQSRSSQWSFVSILQRLSPL